MLKVKSGDLDKLGLLFERYNRVLFGFFYRLCANASTSEDLVQNVFLRMLKYRHTFTGDGKFTTWMYHLARNVWADFYKKNRKMGMINNLDKVERMPGDNEYDFSKEENVKLLRKALDYLSEEKREILILSRYQGLQYKEIADILDCTEANVKVKVYRAIHELRKIFMRLENY